MEKIKDALRFLSSIQTASILSILVFGCIIFSPDVLTLIKGEVVTIPVLSNLSFEVKMTFLLTFAIAVFAQIEGYSTNMQVKLQERRFQIEDLRNELEKAYGILYSILNYKVVYDSDKVQISDMDTDTIDEIISLYPWMIPDEIIKTWNSLRSIDRPSDRITRVRTTKSKFIGFKEKVNEEYNKRVEKYNKLVGKKGDSA